MRRRIASWSLLLAACAGYAQEPARPTPPERFAATVRIVTRPDTQGRLGDLRGIAESLKELGFVDTRTDPELDKFDPAADTITGTIPSATADRIRSVPGVQAVLLVPEGRELSGDLTEVRLTLPDGLDRRDLHRQTVALLGRLGFREHVGYDDQAFRLVRGVIPTPQVERLLADLRLQPAGWFLPQTLADELPLPIRTTLPIRQIEVLPPRQAPAELAPTPVLAGPLEAVRTRLSPGLIHDLAARPAEVKLVEVVLANQPGNDWPAVRDRLRGASPGVSVEGLLGTVVTARVLNPESIAALARLPEVAAVRLPQVAVTSGTVGPPSDAPTPDQWLAATNVSGLHARGYRGEGRSVAILAADFPDAIDKLNTPGTPEPTLIDLTALAHPDLVPRPMNPGVGTAAALAVRAAAPDAKLVLVRVSPDIPYQFLTVAQSAGGDREYSEALRQRALGLQLRQEDLASRRIRVESDYARARDSVRFDDDGPARFDAARQALDDLQAAERTLNAAVERFGAVKAQLDSLRGTTVLYNTLTASAGHPQDGLSDLSRYLDEFAAPAPVRFSRRLADRAPSRPIWVQAAAATDNGDAWSGPLVDADRDGKLEFRPAAETLTTPELGFLRFESPSGERADTIPAATRVRVVVQWREPRVVDRPAAEPSLSFTPRLLRQLDPAGERLATDEFEPVPAVTSPPVRLLGTLGGDAYEQVVEMTTPVAGRYALEVAFGPARVAVVSSARPSLDLTARLALETPGDGTVLFAESPDHPGGVGVPGDSTGAVTVGTTASSAQAGPGIPLRIKPDLTAPARITVGGVTLEGPVAGAALVAGSAACLAQAGVRLDDAPRALGQTPGGPLAIPNEWVDSLRPNPTR